MEPDLSVDIAGLRMRTPVMVASGTFGFGREYAQLMDMSKLGAIVVKGLTKDPSPGNPPPRIAETPSGMLNSIGLQNPGVDCFLREELPWLRQFGVPIIANVSADTINGYQSLCERFANQEGIAGLEINVSCPNVERGGMAFGTDPNLVRRVTEVCTSAWSEGAIIVKLTPNVGNIVEAAKAAQDGGADAVSLINTVLGMAIDVESRRTKIAAGMGGLSGPAIRPIAVRMVWQVAQAVSIPVIGMGGVSSHVDALEFLIAGARAVAVGTATFSRPAAALEVTEGLRAWLRERSIPSVNDVVGTLRFEPADGTC